MSGNTLIVSNEITRTTSVYGNRLIKSILVSILIRNAIVIENYH